MKEAEQTILKEFDKNYLTDIHDSKLILQTLQKFLDGTSYLLNEAIKENSILNTKGYAEKIREISDTLEVEILRLEKGLNATLDFIYQEVTD